MESCDQMRWQVLGRTRTGNRGRSDPSRSTGCRSISLTVVDGSNESERGCDRQSQRLQRTASKFAFQIRVALVAGNQLAEDFADAAMAARELDHSVGEGCAPE